jgi:hypothetical protein
MGPLFSRKAPEPVSEPLPVPVPVSTNSIADPIEQITNLVKGAKTFKGLLDIMKKKGLTRKGVGALFEYIVKNLQEKEMNSNFGRKQRHIKTRRSRTKSKAVKRRTSKERKKPKSVRRKNRRSRS